jgi:hypothetical protein
MVLMSLFVMHLSLFGVPPNLGFGLYSSMSTLGLVTSVFGDTASSVLKVVRFPNVSIVVVSAFSFSLLILALILLINFNKSLILWISNLKKLIKEQFKRDSGSENNFIPIGHVENSNVPFGITEQMINHHVHVMGASGFGKTVFLSHILKNRILSGKGLMFLDLKGDVETLGQIRSWVDESGRQKDFKFFFLNETEGNASYNPVLRGNASQITDRIISSYDWTEEYYRAQCTKILLRLISGFTYLRDLKNEPFDLFDINEALSYPERVLKIKLLVPIEEVLLHKMLEEVIKFQKDKHKESSLEKIRSHIDELCLSNFGARLKTNSQAIDLFDAYRKNQIIYFSLSSRSYPSSAVNLGRMLLGDLKAMSEEADGLKIDQRQHFSVVIDEFSNFASDSFIDFLDRARSSKIGVVLAHQELADLKKISETLPIRILQLCSTTF